jgi:deoxycytidylate deaminase
MPSRKEREVPSAPEVPELFFGLVGATGTGLTQVTTVITTALGSMRYVASTIRLSDLLHEIPKWHGLHTRLEGRRLHEHMDAGNAFRELMGRGDALALQAIAAIRELRERTRRRQSHHRAWILRSLKHPAEVDTLRQIYGSSFILVAAYAPRETRIRNLAKNIAQSHHSVRFNDYLDQAETLARRDEEEVDKEFGQDVRDTFPFADVFIDASNEEGLKKSVTRFLESLFGYPFHTPSKDEYGMFHAQAAGLRSASLGRQVGAAIAGADGEVVSLGTNEVPKMGGLYWSDDQVDQRDFRLGFDIGERMRRNNLAEVLDSLVEAKWLNKKKTSVRPEDRVSDALQVLRRTQFMKTIEFGRAVHAEMAAIVDAARRGAPLKGSTLYTTTFPCHECARHIVATGILRVVYIEPYPKSLALEFHHDSIAVDSPDAVGRVQFEPFVGVAPRRYMEMFLRSGRKTGSGEIAAWDASKAIPKISVSSLSIKVDETAEVRRFARMMAVKGLKPKDTPRRERN